LTPDGVLSSVIFDTHYKAAVPARITRWMSLMVTALEKRGIQKPANHVFVMASSRLKDSVPYIIELAKTSPFTPAEINTLLRFAASVDFDVWHAPGKEPDNPIAFIACSTKEEREEFFREHYLNLWPATDDSPFFFNYVKWRTLLTGFPRGAPHPFVSLLGTENLLLVVAFMFAVVFSTAFIIWPLFRFRKAGLQTSSKWNYIIYFAALGLGFIFIEISYIQRFVLFLGYPTYSLTVILFSILTFSGVGSYLSGKLSVTPKRLIVISVILLSTVALGYLMLLPPVFDYFLGTTKPIRIAVSLVLLAPLGLLLGTFFPTGIRIVSGDNDKFVPWAWGINGCASVIGIFLSFMLAITYGFGTVTQLAVIIYILGTCAMLLTKPAVSRPA
jgi:hypothetical protein